MGETNVNSRSWLETKERGVVLKRRKKRKWKGECILATHRRSWVPKGSVIVKMETSAHQGVSSQKKKEEKYEMEEKIAGAGHSVKV